MTKQELDNLPDCDCVAILDNQFIHCCKCNCNYAIDENVYLVITAFPGSTVFSECVLCEHISKSKLGIENVQSNSQ